ncbi:MAG TPA: dUTP diphosphatase [Clostridiales bacterium]|nr:dUTP diphosphatase [Clostridiales bacterium]
MKLKICRLNEKARLPERATDGSAGMDLFALLDQPLCIKAGQRALVPTGIAISLPSPNYVALIYARSGLAIKKGLTLSNCVGVIDSDYRGEIKVGLINLSDEDCVINPYDRIAQMVVAPIELPEIQEVAELDETIRGAGGFGSTGV